MKEHSRFVKCKLPFEAILNLPVDEFVDVAIISCSLPSVKRAGMLLSKLCFITITEEKITYWQYY
jgi:hypothetical protein